MIDHEESVEARLKRFLSQEPRIDPSAYVSPYATVIGAVTLGAYASVWPGSVLRADINSISIGEGSNVQDGCVMHLSDDFGVRVGNYVTIGHLAMIHACTIEDECLIGMHATVLDEAVIGRRSVIGAHSLVTKGMRVPPGSVVMGVPAKVVKTLSEPDQANLRYWAEKYIKVAAAHRSKDELTY